MKFSKVAFNTLIFYVNYTNLIFIIYYWYKVFVLDQNLYIVYNLYPGFTHYLISIHKQTCLHNGTLLQVHIGNYSLSYVLCSAIIVLCAALFNIMAVFNLLKMSTYCLKYRYTILFRSLIKPIVIKSLSYNQG